ncbi:hypothetical protein [Paenibacillus sp. sgz302251]|uniref:hypothetical protein n=1 Tax=Paenibacillus sp. sgz302251 TaxID=3414493 RepID=UPI003C7DFC79
MDQLTKTQCQVLGVLYENDNEWLTPREIQKRCQVNLTHIDKELKKFMNGDLVYQPTIESEFLISPDGKSAYLSHCSR